MADTNTIEFELHKKAFSSLTKTYLRLGRAHPNEFLASYDEHMIAMHKLHAKLTTPANEEQYEEQAQAQGQEQEPEEDVEIEEVEENGNGNESEDKRGLFGSESEEEQVVQPARISETIKRARGLGDIWSEEKFRKSLKRMKAQIAQDSQRRARRQLDIKREPEV